MSNSLAQATCKVNQSDILGAWTTADNQFEDFEEFELSKDGKFNSWLHQRPDILNAKWLFKNCHLIITTSDIHFDYQIKIKSRQLLMINSEDEKLVTSRYKRIK